MAFPIAAPFPFFTDLAGDPLDAGFIYIGAENQNPQTNPITVYWDSAATITAAQPLRTEGGYIYRNGSPANIYVTASASITVRDRNRALVFTSPSQSGPITAADLANTSNVALGDALVGFRQSNAAGLLPDTVGRTVHQKLQEIVSVKDFGAAGDGSDASTAIQNAIDALAAADGGTLLFPEGIYAASGLSVPDNSRITLLGQGRNSILRKNANGALVSLGAECSMETLAIEGEGGTYTGTGVTITSGALNMISWRRIQNCWIIDTASYCVEFIGNRSGYFSRIEGCDLLPSDHLGAASTPAVKFPTNGSVLENNGNRWIVDCWTASNPIVDLAYSNDSQIVGSQGAVPLFSSATAKATIVGCRLVQYPAGPTWTIDGDLHAITGNTMSLTQGANSITFSSGLSGLRFSSNAYGSASIIDNAPGASQSNEIYYGPQTYTPTLTASGTPFALGNGTAIGRYERHGTVCHFHATITMGGTTSFGTGFYTLSIPFAAARNMETGTAYFEDGGSAWNVGVYKTTSSASTVTMNTASSTVAIIAPTVPWTWASTDIMTITGDFFIE